MRIIAGTKARMTLLPPADHTTRPITDRVKESLFAIVAPKLHNACVADLFCGTGSLGLEALSRNARLAVMVENHRDALQRLRSNIDKLGFSDRTRVVAADIFRTGIPSVSSLPGISRADTEPIWNLVFVDPPYVDSRDTRLDSPLGRLLTTISSQVADRAMVVLRHEKYSNLLSGYADLHLEDCRHYGSMALSFLENIVG